MKDNRESVQAGEEAIKRLYNRVPDHVSEEEKKEMLVILPLKIIKTDRAVTKKKKCCLFRGVSNFTIFAFLGTIFI